MPKKKFDLGIKREKENQFFWNLTEIIKKFEDGTSETKIGIEKVTSIGKNLGWKNLAKANIQLLNFPSVILVT